MADAYILKKFNFMGLGKKVFIIFHKIKHKNSTVCLKSNCLLTGLCAGDCGYDCESKSCMRCS